MAHHHYASRQVGQLATYGCFIWSDNIPFHSSFRIGSFYPFYLDPTIWRVCTPRRIRPELAICEGADKLSGDGRILLIR